MIWNLRFAGRTPINIIVVIVAVVPPALAFVAFAARTHLYHIAVGATVDSVHTLH